MLDLKALLATARVEARIKTPEQSLKARLAQRDAAALAAEAHAKALEKRLSLAKALSCEGLDAMRFRWLAEESQQAERLRIIQSAGQGIDQLRNEIDLAIKREAIRKMSEERRRILA